VSSKKILIEAHAVRQSAVATISSSRQPSRHVLLIPFGDKRKQKISIFPGRLDRDPGFFLTLRTYSNLRRFRESVIFTTRNAGGRQYAVVLLVFTLSSI
jgi:hypothetical protein